MPGGQWGVTPGCYGDSLLVITTQTSIWGLSAQCATQTNFDEPCLGTVALVFTDSEWSEVGCVW